MGKYGDTILDAIDEELESLELQRMQMKGVFNELNIQIKKYEKMRAIYVEEKKPRKSKTPAKTVRHTKQRRAQGSTYLDILERFKSMPEAEFNAKDLASVLGVAATSVNKILSDMREVGLIDLTRKGGKTGTTKYFKLALSQSTHKGPVSG